MNEAVCVRLEELLERCALESSGLTLKRVLDEARREAVQLVNVQLAKLREVNQMGELLAALFVLLHVLLVLSTNTQSVSHTHIQRCFFFFFSSSLFSFLVYVLRMLRACLCVCAVCVCVV